MLRIQIGGDTDSLEPMTRVRYFDLCAEYGEEKAQKSGLTRGHDPKLLGEMYAFQALMHRPPMPSEFKNLRRIALAYRG